MPKIVSVALNKETEKIYNKINKLRKYGWFSKDVRQMLINKYGNEKDILVQQLTENQKEINKLYGQNKELAKKINKVKNV